MYMIIVHMYAFCESSYTFFELGDEKGLFTHYKILINIISKELRNDHFPIKLHNYLSLFGVFCFQQRKNAALT